MFSHSRIYWGLVLCMTKSMSCFSTNALTSCAQARGCVTANGGRDQDFTAEPFGDIDKKMREGAKLPFALGSSLRHPLLSERFSLTQNARPRWAHRLANATPMRPALPERGRQCTQLFSRRRDRRRATRSGLFCNKLLCAALACYSESAETQRIPIWRRKRETSRNGH